MLAGPLPANYWACSGLPKHARRGKGVRVSHTVCTGHGLPPAGQLTDPWNGPLGEEVSKYRRNRVSCA